MAYIDDFGRAIPDAPDVTSEVNASIKALRNYANVIPSFPLTALAPDPQLPGPLGYIPGTGAVEGVGGLIGSTWKGAADLLNADPRNLNMQYGLRIPGPPQALLDAGQHFEENRAQIKQGLDTYSGGILQQPDMNTAAGQFADLTGSAIGAGVGYLPAGLASGIARAAPTGLKTLSGFVAPAASSTGFNMPITAGLGAAAAGVEALTNPDLQYSNVPTPPPTNPTETQQPASIRSLTEQALTDRPPPEAAPSLVGDWQSQLHAVSSGQAEPSDVGPTFGQQGYSNLETWHVIGGLGLTILGLGIGKAVHGRMAKEMNAVGRDQRFNDPEYAQQAADYNNSVIRRGGTEISPPVGQKPIVAPLPRSTVLGEKGTALAKGTVNEVADTQRYLQLSADTPSEGLRLAQQFGNTFDSAHVQHLTERFVETGKDTVSGVHITPPKEAYDAYSALSDAQKKLYSDGLMATSEIQHRRQNNDRPHDFPGIQTPDLGVHISNALADPDVAAAMRLFKDVKSGMADVGEHDNHQFFTAATAHAERTTYIDRMPEADKDGRAIHPGIAPTRNAYTGTAQVEHNPVHLLAQHVEELYKQFLYNNQNRMLRDHQMNLQRMYPNSAQFMSSVKAPTGPHTSYYGSGTGSTFGTARDPVVVVRDKNGVDHVRVDQPTIYRSMTANGSMSARVQLGAGNIARKMVQKGSTGTISAMTGRLHPPVAALYTATQMGGYAPKGSYGGRVDRLVQRNLPESVSNVLSPIARGIDTAGLNQVGAAAHYLNSRATHWMNRGADIFHPTATNEINQKFRTIFGDQWVDSIHQGMKNRYENSTENLYKSQGMGGVGSPLRMDVPGVKERTGEESGIRLVSAGVSPHAFFDGKWMGSKPYVMNVEKVVGEAFSNMADAGHQFWVHLNRDNPNIPMERLVYEARNLTGNPTRSGSNEALRGISSWIPYANVSAQGVTRLGRAIGESPVGAPVAVATGLSMLALASLLSHMRSPEHMDYMQNELSLQQREANVAFATSSDPTAPTLYRMAQEYRPAYAYALDFWSKVINFVGARHDNETFDSVWEGIKSFLGSHVTNSNVDAIIHGTADIVDAANLPPMLGHIDWNSIMHGKSVFDSYSNISKYHNPPPGQGTDAPLDTKNGQIFTDILTNGVGALATALTPLNNAARYYNEGNTFWDSMGMAGHDWLFGAKGANPQLNVIAEVPMRLSTNPPVVEAVRPSLTWFGTLPSMDKPQQLGWTSGRIGAQPVPVTTDKPVSSDPVMRNMLMVAHGYSTRIDQAMVPIKALQQQMAAVNKFGYDPETKRKWMNERTRDIADKMQFVTSIVGDAQYVLSKLAKKTVTFGYKSNIDWSKDSSQFD